MTDKLLIEDGKIQLSTDEGHQVTLPDSKLEDMLRREVEPPVNGVALPDGIKFMEWQPPLLCVVHQRPAHVQRLRWIAHDSPVPFGPGTKFQTRRLSMPYALTFAVYCQHGGRLALTGYNELYFRNEPVRTREDGLCFPALLNVSRIDTPARSRAWICTQYLQSDPGDAWDAQLASLLNHTWNGAFNLSSEHHEGASWFGASEGIHPQLHPVERWEEATAENEAFALGVPWKPASLNVGQLLQAMLAECLEGMRSRPMRRRSSSKAKQTDLASRFVKFVQQSA
jgi:hypothetical protein